jgi:hypothetical protein
MQLSDDASRIERRKENDVSFQNVESSNEKLNQNYRRGKKRRLTVQKEIL